MIAPSLFAALVLTQAAPDASEVLARLDLTSFRNSVGPRHLPRPATPEAAGFTVAAFDNGWAMRSRGDDWSIGLEVLSVEGDLIHVCFSDMARNGGGYFVQTALTLKRSADVYVVTSRAPREGCREMRDRSDAR